MTLRSQAGGLCPNGDWGAIGGGAGQRQHTEEKISALYAVFREIKELRAALLDAITVFGIGENTEFYKHYADIITRARTEVKE